VQIEYQSETSDPVSIPVSGEAQGMVAGILQVKVRVPAVAPSGALPVRFEGDQFTSNALAVPGIWLMLDVRRSSQTKSEC
jgi:hypothetical protein